MAQYVSSGDTFQIDMSNSEYTRDNNGDLWSKNPQVQKIAVGEFFVYKQARNPFCGLIENVAIDGGHLYISLRIRGRMRLPCVSTPAPASDPGEVAYWNFAKGGVTSESQEAVIIGFFATDGYGKDTEVIVFPGMTHPNA